MSKKKKRFIAQVIPEKEWRKLGCSLRQAWNHMWSNCDEVGVFLIDIDKYEFDNGGDEFPLDLIKEKLKDYIEISGEKILLKHFIEVNFGNKLNLEYNPHKSLFRALKENKLKIISSLNQACFKLIDVYEEGDEDEEGDETFEKSEKLLNLEVDSQTLLEISNIKIQIQNEFTWKETI